MKNLLIILLTCLISISGLSQQNPDFERITSEERQPATAVTYVNGETITTRGESVIHPEQISTFPPLDAETDSTGYIFFDFSRSYPYMKFINGQRILLITADQSREIASDLADYQIMDSLAVSYEFQITYLRDLNSQKDSTIIDLRGAVEERENEIEAHNSILANKDKIIFEKDEKVNLYLEDIATKNKTIKKQRIMIGGSLGLAVGVPLAILIFGNR